MRASLLVSPIVAALMFAGCSNDTSLLPFESGAQASPNAVAFTTAVLRTQVGDTARLYLTRSRRSSAGDETIRWRATDPTIVGVEDGLVFPLAPGTTQVTATVHGGTASASVVAWGQIEISGLSITPDPVTLNPGQAVQLDAELHYSNGLVVKLRTSPTWNSLDASVARVVNGKVTGVAKGTARIVAQMSGVADTVGVTVGAPAAPVGQPESPPTPTPAGSFVRPELPREYLNTVMPSIVGRSIRVPAGSSIQAAVDDAQPGDELVLDAGATYTGTITLRNKPGSDWIIIRSNGSLPDEGVRVTPADAPELARLVASRASDRVIDTEPGAHHYRLIGLEITATAGATSSGTLVELGNGGSTQKTVESQPHHLVLDRVYIHGTPTLSFQRCVGLQSASTAIIDSWLSECHGKGMDSQAIAGWNGTGPYKIVNNRLEGAGENVMFGGADPRIPGALPSDIEIRRNHFIKPLAWKGVWTAKNLLEFKIGRRVLIEGNVLENSWVDGQTGFAIKLKSVNQSGKAPWSETSDITFRYNIVRNAAHGVGISGTPEAHPAITGARILFEQNIFDRIGTGDYPGGRLFQISGVSDLTITHNTAISSHSSILMLPARLTRLTVTNNIFSATSYHGVKADGGGSGTIGLNQRATGWVFIGNIMAGVDADRYPAGNSYPSSLPTPNLIEAIKASRDAAYAPPRGRIHSGGPAGADIASVTREVAGVAAETGVSAQDYPTIPAVSVMPTPGTAQDPIR